MVATDGLYNAIVYSQPRCRVECGWSLLSRQAPSYRMNKGEMKRAKTRRDKKKNICMHWEKPACPCVCASVCVYARAEQSCQQQSNKWMNADNVSIAGCIQLNEDILVSRLQFFVVCFSFFLFLSPALARRMRRVSEAHRTYECLPLFRFVVVSFFSVCSRCSLEISHGHNINVLLEHSAKTKRRNSKAIHAAAHIKHTNIKSNQLFLGGLIHYCPAAAAAAATTDPRRIKILSTEKNASVLHLYLFFAVVLFVRSLFLFCTRCFIICSFVFFIRSSSSCWSSCLGCDSDHDSAMFSVVFISSYIFSAQIALAAGLLNDKLSGA